MPEFNFSEIYRAIKSIEKKRTRRIELDFADYQISIYRCSDNLIRADFKKALDKKA